MGFTWRENFIFPAQSIMHHSFFLTLLLLGFRLSGWAQPVGDNVHQVVFLGNSITYAGQYVSDFETCLLLRHPGRSLEVVNAGLPSETVSGLSEPGHAGGKFPRPDLHERLHRLLALVKPEMIIACYGMNDGIYLPFDSTRFNRYREGMIWLHDTLLKTGARVIFMTPPVYDEQRGGATGYSNVLDRYSQWLNDQSASGWEVADLHTPMAAYLSAHRAVDARFGVDDFALADDGVHPGEAGHWLIAKVLLTHLDETWVSRFGSIAAAAASFPSGPAILDLVRKRQEMMKDAWLTAAGHKRPGMRTGLPLAAANLDAVRISGIINRLQQMPATAPSK